MFKSQVVFHSPINFYLLLLETSVQSLLIYQSTARDIDQDGRFFHRAQLPLTDHVISRLPERKVE
jgi:hypothetical protein